MHTFSIFLHVFVLLMTQMLTIPRICIVSFSHTASLMNMHNATCPVCVCLC